MLDEIQHFLSEHKYDCELLDINGEPTVVVTHEIAGNRVQLALKPKEKYLTLPVFLLLKPNQYGKLAHVTVPSGEQPLYGIVCVNAPESLSINFDCPLLVVKDSLERHIALLELALSDPDWNRRELLREFYSNWSFLCLNPNKRPLLINFSEPKLQRVDVYEPSIGAEYGLRSYFVAHPSDAKISKLSEMQFAIQSDSRKVAGKAIVIPIENLTPAPSPQESIKEWYIDTINNLNESTKVQLKELFGQWRDKRYWLVFTAVTVDDERTWFALELTSKHKKALPMTVERIESWSISPVNVRVFNQENVLRRGGGNTSLVDKKVGIVGVGSVGSEIAHKLSAAGIRELTFIDPDNYEIDNLYRHILPQAYVDLPKAIGMVYRCHSQFPWSDSKYAAMELLKFSQDYRLDLYDLLIIAIGDPTQERFFKQHLIDNNIDITTLNCWLEGYGVGGHAVLDINGQKGCLLCAYVDMAEGTRGLHSNLNFIEANQEVMKSIAGCGNQFISYGAVSSAQTAVMASSLAIQYLEGKQTTSCKVSWKGTDDDATAQGIALTHRYYHFKESLQLLPLLNEDCDVCK